MQNFRQLWGITFGIHCWSVQNDKWNFSVLKSSADAKIVPVKNGEDSKILGLLENDTSVCITGRSGICDTGLQSGRRGTFFFFSTQKCPKYIQSFLVSEPGWVYHPNNSRAAGCPFSWGLKVMHCGKPVEGSDPWKYLGILRDFSITWGNRWWRWWLGLI